MSVEQFAGMTAEQAEAFMPNAPRQPVRKRLAELVAGRDVIDIGCGKGEEVGELFTAERYYGIDCSPELIRLARLRWPSYQFAVADVRDLTGIAPCGILKAVLEHLPPNEAVAVFEAARRICGILYVAWHTEPGVEKLTTYNGELGRMLQYRHARDNFYGIIAREVCGPHVIWTVL